MLVVFRSFSTKTLRLGVDKINRCDFQVPTAASLEPSAKPHRSPLEHLLFGNANGRLTDYKSYRLVGRICPDNILLH
jgi:hypothetical protein